jgi:hypothetical protein
MANDVSVDILLLIVQANISPSNTIIKGVIFIIVGRINSFIVKSIIHLIMLPAVIDIIPSNIVGVMIFIFSLIDRNELHILGPHSTTILKRTE